MRGTHLMRDTKQRTGAQLGGVVAEVVAFTMTGCSAPAAAPAPASTSSAPTSTSQTPSASGLPSDAATDAGAPAADPAPVDAEPVPEPGVENDALALAVAAVTAFCRPALDYDTWISELYPFLTQQAAVAYETVDPANVPCTVLTGDARVRDGDGTFTIRVLVPTDAGDYSVYAHRTVETGPWAVEQITPLASE